MTPTQVAAYFNADAEALARTGAPPAVCRVFSLHWSGELAAAETAIAEEKKRGAYAGTAFAGLMDAEQTWLAVKLGRKQLPAVDAATILRCRPAALVYHYALYNHNFWIDHRVAWAHLLRLCLDALFCPAARMRLTALFLVAHMLAIAGWARIGHPMATAIIGRIERHPELASPFSSSLVFSLFPYTTLLRGRLDRVDEVLRRCQAHVPSDPYYVQLYVAGGVYAAAYSGDVVRAELLAAALESIHERTGLMRYRIVAKLLALLPLALRGYSNLVVEQFDRLTDVHDPNDSNPLINSQFYRASALIALCLGQFERAHRYIDLAIRYREGTGSFQSWASIDATIRRMAIRRQLFKPSEHNFFGGSLRLDPPSTLGTLLIGAIHSMRAAFSGPGAFEEHVFELLKSHVGCPAAQLQNEPAAVDQNVCQIRVGSRYVVFYGLASERLPIVELELATVSPVLTILERSVRDLLQLKEENERISKEAAVARTTQMLAHDVRRPLKTLQVAVDAMRRAKTDRELRDIMEELLPEVDKAAANVNALLADVMEIGCSAPLRRETVAPETLLLECIRDVLAVFPDAEVSFDYHFDELSLDIDARRVVRAVSNILTNAIQATGRNGKIWIGASKDQDGWARLWIGNSGSSIATEDLARVFSPFFTKNKPSGTGLGLAIAERVVGAHGGRIWCTSSEVGVEFHLLLPRGHAEAGNSSDDVRKLLPRSNEGSKRAARTVASDLQLNSAGLPIVALVDDSRAFLRGWRSSLGNAAALRFFRSPESFWAAVGADAQLLDRFSVVITDYQFSDSIETGATLAGRLRQHRPTLPVFVSSSGVFGDGELGNAVDAILDKTPIEWPRLQALLASAQQRRSSTGA